MPSPLSQKTKVRVCMRAYVASFMVDVGPARVPNMELLCQLCGAEGMKAELWEELGKALGMSEEKLDKIYIESKDNTEKCKQSVLNVRMPPKPCLGAHSPSFVPVLAEGE